MSIIGYESYPMLLVLINRLSNGSPMLLHLERFLNVHVLRKEEQKKSLSKLECYVKRISWEVWRIFRLCSGFVQFLSGFHVIRIILRPSAPRDQDGVNAG